jgi:hypothetical protein
MKQLQRADTLTFLVITSIGLFQNQVTVFYIVYLFWFQELIRTVVDFMFLVSKKQTIQEKWFFAKLSFGSFFILFIYFVFIVVLFGFMLNWRNSDLFISNVLVLFFKNWYFNVNILLFLAEYIYFRAQADNSNLQLQVFNQRHIILHVSIILGGVMFMVVLPKINITSEWISLAVIAPFLLLKIILDRQETKSESH